MDNPNIFINPEANATAPTKKFNLKIIFIILGVVIAIELIFGIRTLLQSNTSAPKQTANQTQSQTTGQKSVIEGKISLESDKKEYKVGDSILVTIKIDTAGQTTDGTDAVLMYDPQILGTEDLSITKGTVYPDYPVAKVDTETKTIRISGITSLHSEGFSGAGVLATIKFQAKKVGKTTLSFEFSPGATNDTNIVSSKTGDDLLKEASKLSLTIK